MNYYFDALKNYGNFSGRARRKAYWLWVLFNTLVSIVFFVIDKAVGTPLIVLDYGLLYSLYALAVFVPGIAILVRRLHDTGRCGWWAFLLLVPCAGAVVIIIFCVLPSSPDENQYGPCPLEA